jgi:anaerobic selenocysteine-containing dehydrogenase
MSTHRTLAVLALSATAVLTVAGYLMAPPALARQQSARSWRYAYAEARSTSTVEVCYVESAGCRMEVISVPGVPVRGEIGMTDSAATIHRGMIRALGALGAAGWELVGESEAIKSGSARVMVFKRPG